MWGFPAQSAPRAGGRDWLYPPGPPLSCTSVPPVADAQGDSYTSSLATLELRKNGRLAAGRRDSGRIAQCRKATFPPNCWKSFYRGRSHYWRTASLTNPTRFHTHDSPTFQLERRISSGPCRTFSPTASHACGGAVTGAVGGAMSGSQLKCM